jgi:hypothetical protein
LAAACGSGGAHGPATQHEVTAAGELLTSDGRLREPGWSRRQLQHWNPERVHDPARLKQWDFFSVADAKSAVNLTLLDLGFAQLATVGVVDFASGATSTSVVKSPGDFFALSAAVEGSGSLVPLGATQPALGFTTTAEGSAITIDVPASLLGAAAWGALTVHRRPTLEYLSLATPFDEDPHLFFYEQKLPGMSAEGTLTLGTSVHTFAADDSSAVMDWGRGEWPATILWHWAAASGSVDGAGLAFNLGNGFGDDAAGTENLVLRGDVGHKLSRVDWTHDESDPMHDWSFAARDGRLTLTLHPVAVENGGLDLGVDHYTLHKAYGRYFGTVVLDDGTTVTIADLPGFAEEMHAMW